METFLQEVAKEDAIDDAEDGCRRSDAQHQRNNKCERKNGVATEAADGVADILKEGFHLNTENDPVSCRCQRDTSSIPGAKFRSLRNFQLFVRIPHV